LEGDTVFDSYILLSPNIEFFNGDLFDHLEKMSKTKLVYLCTSNNDLTGHKEVIKKLNNKYFSKKKYSNLVYRYQYFNDEDHMSIINKAIPFALEHSFCFYNFTKNKQLSKAFTESKEKEKLYNKYIQKAKELYDVESTLTPDDFFIIYRGIDNSKDWSEYLPVSNILFDKFPDSVHPYYARAMYEEKYKKNYKKALKLYNQGLKYVEESFFDEESYREDIKRVKNLIEK
jgi:hypothetical protein